MSWRHIPDDPTINTYGQEDGPQEESPYSCTKCGNPTDGTEDLCVECQKDPKTNE